MPDIDENEYAELRRLSDVAKLIGANPKARELLHQAVALAAPDQAGPEIRMRQVVDERIGGIEKTITDFITEQRTDREKREAAEREDSLKGQWAKGRQKLRDAGYNDDGLSKIEEIMEKRGIADHEAAMALFERENPQPEVITGGSKWNLFDQPKDDVSLKELYENPWSDTWLDKAVSTAINDTRQGR